MDRATSRPAPRLVLALAAVVIGVLATALPAAAQAPGSRIPDIPGSGPIRRALQDQLASIPRPASLPDGARGLGDVLGRAAPQASLPPLPVPDAPQLDPAADRPAPARRPRPSGGSLPATGAPAVAFGLLGIALLSGGRLLVELTGR